MQGDVERIGALYRLRGYFETRIVPKTIKLKDDRVNLVFEIKENEKLAVRQVVFAGNAAFRATSSAAWSRPASPISLSFALDNDIV